MSSQGPQAPPQTGPTDKTVCVAGTYDGAIVGWELREDEAGADGEGKLQMVFAYTPHQGSIRALAIPRHGVKAGLLLVSGGSDEHIRLYDLRRRAEAGELLYHKGTVTCLGFVGSTHLLSGSDDGTVCIWRVYDWSLLHVLGGHKGPVTALAVHPSGKLALTTGRDRSLRLWDLVNGRCAYITKLDAPAEAVKWSDDGTAYALVIGDRRLEVRRAADNAVTALLTHPLRVTALAFLPPAAEQQHQHVLTGCDDGKLRIVDGATGDLLSETPTAPHCGRVKEAVLLHAGEQDEENGCRRRLVTASSDGRVVVWSVDAQGKEVVAGAAGSLGDGVRITCLAAYAAGSGADVVGEDGGAEAAAGLVKEKEKRKQKHRKGPAGELSSSPPGAGSKKQGPGSRKKKRGLVGAEKGQQPPSQEPPQKKHKPHHHQPQQQKGAGKPKFGKDRKGGAKPKGGFQHQQKQQKHQGKGKGKQGGGGRRAKSEGGVVSFL